MKSFLPLLFAALLVSACAPTRGPAPIESRNIFSRSSEPKAPLPPVPEGSYRVKKGDTVIGISLEYGLDWRDIVAWNNLENPNRIEVDQVLTVRSPKQASTAAALPPSTIAPLAPAPTAAPAQAATASTLAGKGEWTWPARGKVLTGFSEGGSKGISISGNPGDPILAADGGRVVYSGNGLRGYGNLVIVKHDGDFLTAYAHNRAILVKEGQTVTRGQRIAELGSSDADKPMLHFEVRKGGKPVDPVAFLSPR
ncbi:MAG: LysM peptidoglycan-binding domain-containing protein [Betaproteobacteria bacterium]|nr:LysM peptidoglycan-binding domain-containing protein [Betaproteobacteria bacterium]